MCVNSNDWIERANEGGREGERERGREGRERDD